MEILIAAERALDVGRGQAGPGGDRCFYFPLFDSERSLNQGYAQVTI